MSQYNRTTRSFRVSRQVKAILGLRGEVSDQLVTGVWGYEVWEGWR